ncbi:MAG: hypothetical protein ACLUZZ_03585 [Alistipes inops]
MKELIQQEMTPERAEELVAISARRGGSGRRLRCPAQTDSVVRRFGARAADGGPAKGERHRVRRSGAENGGAK